MMRAVANNGPPCITLQEATWPSTHASIQQQRMGSPEVSPARRDLSDFTTDARLLRLTAMAVVIGAMSAFVAYGLVWLIGTITNLVYYHRLASVLVSPA